MAFLDTAQSIYHKFSAEPARNRYFYLLIAPIIYIAAYICIYIPIRFLYRISLHPLASIPGPKSQLISDTAQRYYWWYQAENGNFSNILEQWHQKYGPIFRFSGNEVHIKDIDNFNQLYKIGTKWPKSKFFYDHPWTGESMIAEMDTNISTLRRTAYHPYFSRQSVRKLHTLIEAKIDRFLDRLSQFEKSDSVVNISRGFSCLTCDIITTYSFDACTDSIDHPTFSPRHLIALEETSGTTGYHLLFPSVLHGSVWLFKNVLGFSAAKKLSSSIADILEFEDLCADAALKQKRRWLATGGEATSMFTPVFEDDIKKGRKAATDEQLRQDSLLIVMAGMETTSQALSITFFNLIRYPDVMELLLKEIKTIMPEISSRPTQDQLDQLPLLRACFKESIRCNPPLKSPMSRDTPAPGTEFFGYKIPTGTRIMHTMKLFHTDPAVFPDPQKWDPYRWLAPGANVKELDNNLLSFSRGSRACIGSDLAWAEASFTIAKLLRRFEISYSDDFRAERMESVGTMVITLRGSLTVKLKERAG
ncbi:hypothetical protein H072_6033 [Dactylellina haptotyla CBS 200.50]|uniref:Cytochrome P450 n=1 Tax=Dactylellina haptotyla (strain CBS 200.50) TaxID=1284197 RepID=S8BL60_DACHA|nr:hypothetical protein H072_6033 [Dactylellina haptotyla CBS 200.50]